MSQLQSFALIDFYRNFKFAFLNLNILLEITASAIEQLVINSKSCVHDNSNVIDSIVYILITLNRIFNTTKKIANPLTSRTSVDADKRQNDA